MPNTARLNLEYPAEYQDPWFQIFERFVNGLDAALYAGREDRNLILLGGGTVAWDATAEELSFSLDIVITSPQTGYAMSLSTAESPITIQDGQVLYVDLSRGATGAASLTPYVGNVVPSSNNAFMLAVRRGTIVYFRNGRGFADGDSGTLYIEPSAGAPISAVVRRQVAVQTNGDTWIGDGGATDSAAAQGSLSAGFTSAILTPGGVDVFYNNVLCHYTTGAPASINEWRWVTTGSPAPAIEIGAGSLAGDIVTVKYLS